MAAVNAMGPPPAVPESSDISFFKALLKRSDDGDQRAAAPQPDFQTAVRHGVRCDIGVDPTNKGQPLVKYTCGDIAYITDMTASRVFRAFAPHQIRHGLLTEQHFTAHEAAKQRLRADPSRCSSHTVVVVDQSGSMRAPDVEEFGSRSSAVFGMLAVDFVAKQRLSGQASDTDVVSLVLMRVNAQVVFEREPVGLVLYNKFVALHYNGEPSSHGNYLPALDKADELLKKGAHARCALSLLFLSDGRPSDWCIGVPMDDQKSFCDVAAREAAHKVAEEAITGRVKALADAFGQQLSLSALGFAKKDQDFSVLDAMATTARGAGADAGFHRTGLSAGDLSSSIAHTVCSLTATKSKLTTVRASPSCTPRDVRQVEMEAAASWGQAPTSWEMGDGWVVYTEDVKRLEFCPDAATDGKDPWLKVGLGAGEANCVAIRRRALGEGAERLVFGMQEFDSRRRIFVGPKLVAKESRHMGDATSIRFHDIFAKTQRNAKRIADKFNKKVREKAFALASGGEHTSSLWDVSFLPCHLYTFVEGGTKRGVLAEKKLEPAKGYTTWNGASGYVYTRQAERVEAMDQCDDGDGAGKKEPAGSVPPPFQPAAKRLRIEGKPPVSSSQPATEVPQSETAGGAAPTCDASVPSNKSSGVTGGSGAASDGSCSFDPEPECYVQAFSHFSYVYSNHRMLVCNLQGVQSSYAGSSTTRGGVFDLTDPVIHYSSQSGRDHMYGKKDLGTVGMQKFFQTHTCNKVCDMLGISKETTAAAAT